MRRRLNLKEMIRGDGFTLTYVNAAFFAGLFRIFEPGDWFGIDDDPTIYRATKKGVANQKEGWPSHITEDGSFLFWVPTLEQLQTLLAPHLNNITTIENNGIFQADYISTAKKKKVQSHAQASSLEEALLSLYLDLNKEKEGVTFVRRDLGTLAWMDWGWTTYTVKPGKTFTMDIKTFSSGKDISWRRYYKPLSKLLSDAANEL